MDKQSLPPASAGKQTVTVANLAGKKVICKTFAAGDTMPPHHALTDVLVLVLDGQMDISLGDETSGVPPTRFVAGDYVVIPVNVTHALACIEAARLLIYR